MIHYPKRHRLPVITFLIYCLYQIIFPLIILFSLSFAALRSLKEPSHLKQLAHRFGLGPVGPSGAIWFYAASLGEMNAARPLVKVFLDNGYDILLTHLSPAGLEAGRQLFGNHPQVTHRYMPLDFFIFVKVFLQRARPKCGIVLEVEIWPAMLLEADKLGVPMYLANGNLLEKSMSRLNTWRRSSLHMYRLFDHIFTRADDFVERYKATGVLSKDLTITGELKLDTPRDPVLISLGQSWRKAWAGKQPTFMISSSIKTEEDALMNCCVDLLKQIPTIKVVWVPRSPQRFSAITQKAKKAGLLSARRSEYSNSISNEIQIFIGDTIGEMDLYLGMADIVFVGASFSDMGGHNIVEPLSAGRPVMMGPSTFGVDFIAKDAAAAGIFKSFNSPEQMKDFIITIVQSPQKLKELQIITSRFFERRKSAAEQCYEVINFDG